jgi:hypothetical protein
VVAAILVVRVEHLVGHLGTEDVGLSQHQDRGQLDICRRFEEGLAMECREGASELLCGVHARVD